MMESGRLLKFVAVVKLHQNAADYQKMLEIFEELGGEDAVWNVPDGIKLLDSVHCLSQYDLIAFYEAPDGETAEKMFQELEPIASVDRILSIPCDICDRTKELQKELVSTSEYQKTEDST
jgi:hypothetical protein